MSLRTNSRIEELVTDEVIAASTSFPDEELDVMAANVERELREVGGIHRLYGVWGRRPIRVGGA